MSLYKRFFSSASSENPWSWERLPSLINYERLMTAANELSGKYGANTPFPHIVIDDFLDPEVLNAVIKAFPSPSEMTWMAGDAKSKNGRDAQLKKFQFALGRYNLPNEMLLNPVIRYLLLEMNSATFTRFLNRITKIDNLIADSRMWGGGLHQSARGGLLRVHADFLKHPEFNLDRRLNVLLFLNEEWLESYGGSLELWSKDMQTCEKNILPIANRCVIFTTAEDSYHGFTKPIECPEIMTRKSIAMYYYTVPGEDLLASPETFWQDLPEERTD
jgi:Rps23 Pro-64 3,4-dihydroxylase Tpa1-like proline 4-hydroxylase